MGRERQDERPHGRKLAWLVFGLWLACPMICLAQEDVPPSRVERLSDPVYMSWIAHHPVSKCVSCHVLGPSDAEVDTGHTAIVFEF